MVDQYSTGGVCPAKTLSYDDLYIPHLAEPYSIGEPERPPYGKSSISDTARLRSANIKLLLDQDTWRAYGRHPVQKIEHALSSRFTTVRLGRVERWYASCTDRGNNISATQLAIVRRCQAG